MIQQLIKHRYDSFSFITVKYVVSHYLHVSLVSNSGKFLSNTIYFHDHQKLNKTIYSKQK